MKLNHLPALPGVLLLLLLGVTGPPASTAACVTSSLQGRCPAAGFYSDPDITGAENLWVNQDAWGAGGTNYASTLTATSPGDWNVAVSVSGNTSGRILAFPNAGWTVAWDSSGHEQPVDSFTSIPTSWDVTIPAASAVGWAAYDLWFNGWADEVMIQTDIIAGPAYDCAAVTAATFGGMPWHMCRFGSERVWKPGTDDQHLQNMPAGSLDVQPFLAWMEANGQLPAGSTWTAGSFGFEVSSGLTAQFTVHGLTWHPAAGVPTVAPAPGGLSQTAHVIVNFSWSAVAGTLGYEFQLALGTTVVADEAVSGTHLSGTEVNKDTAYRWRVRATGGTWSGWRTFTSP